ncbi:hypothetical protein B0H16DRAFT_1552613 [Mycena metata]|uniref:Uncharacterized protein n=1 Tax=Mycena metata TaxID=1033252 RepID=A0AAD7N784_9AGAR|nr:hypothetical protein B0H16DRAFT_1552564 [Mycena metata]KAJ7748610.1 hypothetical protein B0H16DRAFT_1552613 [Mycena metata]
MYASEFIHSLPPPPSRPASPASDISDSASVASQNSANFEPVKGKQNVSKEDKAALRDLLVNWRKDRHFRIGNSPYIPCEVLLPPKQLERLVASAGTFLKHPLVEPKHVQKAVPWDMAPDSDVAEVCDVIARWRLTLDIRRTPQSARRPRKRTQQAPTAPTPQPVFTQVPPTAPRSSPRGRGRGRGRAAPVRSSLSAHPTPPSSTPVSSSQTPVSSTPSMRYDDFFSAIPASRTFTPRPLHFTPVNVNTPQSLHFTPINSMGTTPVPWPTPGAGPSSSYSHP